MRPARPPAAPPAPGRPRWGPEPDRASLSCLRARPPAGAPLVCSQRAPLVRRAPAPAPAACPTSTHGGRAASPAAPASRRRPGQQPRRELRVRAGRRPGRRQAEKSPAGKWPRGSGRAGTGRLRGQMLSKALPSRTEAGQELPSFPDEETEARVFKRLGKAPACHHRVWTRAQLPSPALPHASGGQTLRSGPSVVLAPLTESWACFPGILSPPHQAGLGSRGRQTWGVSGNRAARPGPPPVASPVGLGGPDQVTPQASSAAAVVGISRLHSHAPPSPRRPAAHGRLKRCLLLPQPEDASGGSSPSGTSKSDANRASSGGGGGGLMEEMNKLLAKRWVSRLPKTHARQEAPAPQRVSVLAQPRGVVPWDGHAGFCSSQGQCEASV